MFGKELKGFYDRNGIKHDLPEANKADRVKNAVAGNFASLDENGNLMDSEKNAGDFASAEDFATLQTQLNNKANITHTHQIGQVNGLQEYLEALSARITSLENAAAEEGTITITWETVDDVVIAGVGQNGNDYDSTNLYNFEHISDFEVGDRIKLVNASNSSEEAEGEVLRKETGPDRLNITIDMSQLTHGIYHLQKATIAAAETQATEETPAAEEAQSENA